MNTFMRQMSNTFNIGTTENGGVTRNTTNSAVLDMFGVGAAYRSRSTDDILFLFNKAFEEDPLLAMKCLFYIGDCRGGQGERRFFRTCFRWLCKHEPAIADKNLINIPVYRRWDDLIYTTTGTRLWSAAMELIKRQLEIDKVSRTPSLLAKWLPSQNASNKMTKMLGYEVAAYLRMSSKEYRKTLSTLRERIKVVEKLMSANRWDEIEFDKIPSRAGFIYKNAFARRDIIAKKYEAFAKNSHSTVNAKTLYPYDIAHKAFEYAAFHRSSANDVDRLMIQKYWDNLPNYYGNKQENAIAIVDTSGSMSGSPLEAAVSLGAYVADKSTGPFANHFITFSDNPRLVKFEGIDIVDKLCRCRNADWGGSTNLEAVFDLLLNTAKKEWVSASDMPKKLYIFSDMEFNHCVNFNSSGYSAYNKYRSWSNVGTIEEVNSDLEKIAKKWAAAGYKLPKVIFWNLNARNDRIPAIGEGFSYVSGLSPSMIECILSGKDGYDLMLEKLMSRRYNPIRI